MSFYKVIGGQWGEGHQPGDIIQLDENAARVRLAEGHIEPAKPSAKSAEPAAPASTVVPSSAPAKRARKSASSK